MAVEVNILVCVCGLAIDVKIECAVGVVDDGDVQHGDATILLDLFGPLDVGMNGVEIVVQWLDVVVVYGDESVVGFSQPEENDVTGRDGIVTSGVFLSRLSAQSLPFPSIVLNKSPFPHLILLPSLSYLSLPYFFSHSLA